MHRVVEETTEQCLSGGVWRVRDDGEATASDRAFYDGMLQVLVEIGYQGGQVGAPSELPLPISCGGGGCTTGRSGCRG